jgi:YidC/Oxa1 family membrane protein insertase
MLQKMSQPPKGSSSSNDPQQRMMGQMMFLMPIMFGYITLTLPSGLTLYWTTSNILAMVQQYFLTGWGGLTSWLPFLGTKEPAVATTAVPAAAAGAVSTSTGSASVSTTSTSSTAELADPTKSPKRKRRRRS